ncbi:MAG: LuxR C-terminal-related transcriptional regulator, partial [Acidimicrobiales bacterium]
GAGGYLLKDTALVDIAASIRTAASGQAVLSPTMAAKLVEDFARPIPGAAAALSTRELEVLHLIADDLANRQIAEELSLSVHTVKRHVANILAKLHQRTRSQAFLAAHRQRLLGPRR